MRRSFLLVKTAMVRQLPTMIAIATNASATHHVTCSDMGMAPFIVGVPWVELKS